MEDVEKRKRINRYKKMIIRTLIILIIITMILWGYIIFRLNDIENKIDSLGVFTSLMNYYTLMLR